MLKALFNLGTMFRPKVLTSLSFTHFSKPATPISFFKTPIRLSSSRSTMPDNIAEEHRGILYTITAKDLKNLIRCYKVLKSPDASMEFINLCINRSSLPDETKKLLTRLANRAKFPVDTLRGLPEEEQAKLDLSNLGPKTTYEKTTYQKTAYQKPTYKRPTYPESGVNHKMLNKARLGKSVNFHDFIALLKSNSLLFTTLMLKSKQLINLKDKDKEDLLKSLKQNKTLTRLNLSGNKIDLELLTILYNAIKDNYTLTDLRYETTLTGGPDDVPLLKVIMEINGVLARNQEWAKDRYSKRSNSM